MWCYFLILVLAVLIAVLSYKLAELHAKYAKATAYSVVLEFMIERITVRPSELPDGVYKTGSIIGEFSGMAVATAFEIHDMDQGYVLWHNPGKIPKEFEVSNGHVLRRVK